MTSTAFIPALGYDSLTEYYDYVVRWTCRENKFKTVIVMKIIEEIKKFPHSHCRILDVGSGTGTLTWKLAVAIDAYLQKNNDFREEKDKKTVEIIGVDIDPHIIQLAERKRQEIVNSEIKLVFVKFVKASADSLPFQNQHFHVVTSSLLFHHLSKDVKVAAFREMRRVLLPEGSAIIADWGIPANSLMRLLFYFIQILDGFSTTSDNVEGLIPILMQQGGLPAPKEICNISTIFGTLTISFASAKY